MNNSATGGYVKPISTQPLPRGLSLVQFIQTVIVGVSALDGTLVRPEWQPAPPKNPDIEVNWIAFGISEDVPDANSFVGMDKDGNTISQRQETLHINCSVYGPDALDIATLIRDGFQIQQNLEALRAANMGFVEVTRALHIPDLVNERFINRWRMEIVLRRQVQRVYPILPILSATGKIHTVIGDEPYLINWTSTNG